MTLAEYELPPDYERAQLFPNGKQVHVEVVYVEGVASYDVQLCYVGDATEFGDKIEVVERIGMAPGRELMPVVGRFGAHLDPERTGSCASFRRCPPAPADIHSRRSASASAAAVTSR